MLLVSAQCASCAGAAVPPSSPAAVRVQPVSPSSVLPLTADEAVFEAHVAEQIKNLVTRIGERNVGKPWGLAEAADYLFAELENLGLPADRRGHEVDGVLALDIGATAGGGERGDETLVLATRYDSPPGDVGSSGAASVAVLLELARVLRGATFARTVRFVFFAGSPPEGQPRRSGELFLVLEPLHQAAPGENRATQARLVITSNDGGVGDAFREAIAGYPFEIDTNSGESVHADGLARAFSGLNSRVVELRTRDPLDTSDLARLVGRLRFGVARLAGFSTNDATLTPGLEDVR